MTEQVPEKFTPASVLLMVFILTVGIFMPIIFSVYFQPQLPYISLVFYLLLMAYVWWVEKQPNVREHLTKHMLTLMWLGLSTGFTGMFAFIYTGRDLFARGIVGNVTAAISSGLLVIYMLAFIFYGIFAIAPAIRKSPRAKRKSRRFLKYLLTIIGIVEVWLFFLGQLGTLGGGLRLP